MTDYESRRPLHSTDRPARSSPIPSEDRRKDWAFYNKRSWRKLSRRQLAAEPLCRHCRRRGQLTPATVADHIIPRKDRPDLALDPDNLQSLCKPCHQRKSLKETTGRRR